MHIIPSLGVRATALVSPTSADSSPLIGARCGATGETWPLIGADSLFIAVGRWCSPQSAGLNVNLPLDFSADFDQLSRVDRRILHEMRRRSRPEERVGRIVRGEKLRSAGRSFVATLTLTFGTGCGMVWGGRSSVPMRR